MCGKLVSVRSRLARCRDPGIIRVAAIAPPQKMYKCDPEIRALPDLHQPCTRFLAMQASHAWTVGSFCEVKGLCVPVPRPRSHNPRGPESARFRTRSQQARGCDSTCVLTLRSAALATTARQKGLQAPGFLRKWSVRPPASTAPT